MNCGVAQRARLKLGVLTVGERGAARTCTEADGVALQAKKIDLRALQQPRVYRSVWLVARVAAVRFDGRMLKDEWPRRFRMAFAANLLLCRGGAQLTLEKSAVLVVAFGTAHQFLVDPMMKGASKLGRGLRVAGGAKLWLGFDQQKSLGCGMMHRVAIQARYLRSFVS